MTKILIKAKVWIYPGVGAWHFVNTGNKETKILRDLPRQKKAGFGSIKVHCTIGKTSWETSLFPSKEGPYLLPLKTSVRRAEGIAEGDMITVHCKII